MTGAPPSTPASSEARPSAGQDLVYIDALMARLARDGDACVLRYQGRDTRASDLLGMIARHARALAGIGVGRGRLVALFAPNSPEALAVRYAANLLGAAAVYLSDPG